MLQADGGTRTAAITGAYVALVDACRKLQQRGKLGRSPLHGQVAAVSVGIFENTPVLDLDYPEDTSAETDMNVVMNDGGGFIEVQGTAEGHAFRREELDALLDLAGQGISELMQAQDQALDGEWRRRTRPVWCWPAATRASCASWANCSRRWALPCAPQSEWDTPEAVEDAHNLY